MKAGKEDPPGMRTDNILHASSQLFSKFLVETYNGYPSGARYPGFGGGGRSACRTLFRKAVSLSLDAFSAQ